MPSVNEPCVYIRPIENKSPGQIKTSTINTNLSLAAHYGKLQHGPYDCVVIIITMALFNKVRQSAWSLCVIDWNAMLDWRLWIIQALWSDFIWLFSAAAGDTGLSPFVYFLSLVTLDRLRNEMSTIWCVPSASFAQIQCNIQMKYCSSEVIKDHVTGGDLDMNSANWAAPLDELEALGWWGMIAKLSKPQCQAGMQTEKWLHVRVA